ncbi:MAG: orotate phosphoribosyltransferase [Candidatus Kaiserbacteria bacterium]|nr:orotate phosphoribosyltransferase [Candidatus Kaiserbacteria bacterium]
MLEKVEPLRADWVYRFTQSNALWVSDLNPKRPHAVTTTGRHTAHYFDSRSVVENKKLLAKAAKDSVKLLMHTGVNLTSVDCVVGPAKGGTKFAEFLSSTIAHQRGFACSWASPSKHDDGNDKWFVFDDLERIPQRGQTVLMCDDTLTTGSSFELIQDALRPLKVNIVDTVCVLLNRYGLSEIRGRNIVSLVDCAMPTWDPFSCQLCRGGSSALRPRVDNNWKLLTAKY